MVEKAEKVSMIAIVFAVAIMAMPATHVFAVNIETVEEEEITTPTCVAGVNLIQNGSFETPVLPEGGYGWDIFDSVSNGLVWVVEWITFSADAPVLAKLELQGGYYTASAGTQFAELDSNWNPADGGPYGGEDARVRISQEIDTIPGATYRVAYAFSPLPYRDASTNVLKVLVNGDEVAEHTADGTALTDTDWKSYTHDFVATGAKTTIGFRDAGTADSFGTLLDAVSVECIPADEIHEEKETPRKKSSGGGRRTPKVAGESISVPDTDGGEVLGATTDNLPQGAPKTGNGGTSGGSAIGSLGQLFLDSRRVQIVK
jgi:hypothetical protein